MSTSSLNASPPRRLAGLLWLTPTVVMSFALLGVVAWVAGESARLRRHGASRDATRRGDRRLVAPAAGSGHAAAPRGDLAVRGSAAAAGGQGRAFLLALADSDGREALRLTAGIADEMERRALRLEIVKRWAVQHPADAVAWADGQPDGEWQPALASAFAGAAAQPWAAIELAERLIHASRARAGDYGEYLIAGLVRAAAFTEAAGFAVAAPVEFRAAWLHDAFFHWGANDAAAAVRACAQLSGADVRLLATKGLIAGWATAAPAAVASYALALEPRELRVDALSQALPQWVARDPAAAAAWLVRQDLSPDFDVGSAALATQPELLRSRPALAITWAASIAEPALRANALRAAAIEWGRRNPAALAEFIATAVELPDADRSILRDGLTPPPDA